MEGHAALLAVTLALSACAAKPVEVNLAVGYRVSIIATESETQVGGAPAVKVESATTVKTTEVPATTSVETYESIAPGRSH